MHRKEWACYRRQLQEQMERRGEGYILGVIPVRQEIVGLTGTGSFSGHVQM